MTELQWRSPGQGAAAGLAAAVLFGLGVPLAKLAMGSTRLSPWLLAGLLYTGAGVSLGAFRVVTRKRRVVLARSSFAPLAAAVLLGGVAAPVLLMLGLSRLDAASASLLLNTETVLTAGLAWTVFREHTSRRIVLGMVAIVAATITLTWAGTGAHGIPAAALLVIAACLCWALDNNLTRVVAIHDGTWLATIKGLVAGPINLALAAMLGAATPSMAQVIAASAIGAVSYGVSLALFVVALRELGSSRASAYFAVAPFVGTGFAIVALGEALTTRIIVAASLMGVGVWLHLTEAHVHDHNHAPLEHAHPHHHDEHHRHSHDRQPGDGRGHDHLHRHKPLTHRHEHYPDAHHRHGHEHRHEDGSPC